jgi:hypothetical protein
MNFFPELKMVALAEPLRVSPLIKVPNFMKERKIKKISTKFL